MAEPVLLLGGTAEAVELAHRLDANPDISLIVSLAGRTRSPVRPPGELRLGGFGGADALVRFLESHRITAVIDATHPFASQISANAAKACEKAGCPRITLLRPPWAAGAKDRWRPVKDMVEAAEALAPGARVLLTTGHRGVDAFAKRQDVHFSVRLIEPPEAPLVLPGAKMIFGRGPFTVAEEAALFDELEIDTLVTKNSGGDGSRAKLEAARDAGIGVVMIERPAPPPGQSVAHVEEVLAWLKQHV